MPVRRFAWLFIVALAVPLGCQTASKSVGLVVGTGASSEQDPQVASAAAAKQALAALGSTKPKLVLVFDQVQSGEAVLRGVNSVVDPNIVFGCESYSPLTEEGNNPKVGVLAIGGDMEVQPAMAKLDGGHEKCGREIGKQLKAAAANAPPVQFMILFGSCHVPSDDQLVGGIRAELGDKFPVVGAAASGGMNIYYQGKAMKDINVGLWIRGKFRCNFAMKEAQGNGKDKLVSSAKEAVAQTCSVGADAAVSPTPALVFIFDCGGRRGQLGDQLQAEFDAMKKAAGGVKMFGFYGSGEIGPADNTSPSRGVGYHIVSCAVYPLAPK
jgi:hypothetical protein